MVKDWDQDTIYLRGQFFTGPNQEDEFCIMSLIPHFIHTQIKYSYIFLCIYLLQFILHFH